MRRLLKSALALDGEGRGWGDLLSRRWSAASTAAFTPPLPLPIEGRGRDVSDRAPGGSPPAPSGASR
nr:hypothetical protein [Caulobacter vibrioides]